MPTLLSSLRPTKWKLVVTVVLGALWVAGVTLFGTIYCDCMAGGFRDCTDFYWLALVRLECHCDCWTLGQAMANDLFLLGPPIGPYGLWSLVEWGLARRRATSR